GSSFGKGWRSRDYLAARHGARGVRLREVPLPLPALSGTRQSSHRGALVSPRRRSRVSERSDLACKAIPCLQRHMRCRHERHHGSGHGSRNQLWVESFWLPFGMDGYDQSNAMPPSTRRLIPVTKLLESVARKSAAWASSAGWPSRLS